MPADKGWAQSCALIGCLVGALVSGGLSDRFGRKWLLFLAAVIFAVTSVGTGMAGSFDSFVVWRMLGGVAIGLASNLSPMYISEISPSAMRGRLVSLNQFTIVIGVLLAQVVNLWVAQQFPDWLGGAKDVAGALAWNEASGWRWMFGITAVPSLLFLLGMLVVPESPRWLVKNGHPEKASRILAKIGGEDYARERAGVDRVHASRTRPAAESISAPCSNAGPSRSCCSASALPSSSNGAAST